MSASTTVLCVALLHCAPTAPRPVASTSAPSRCLLSRAPDPRFLPPLYANSFDNGAQFYLQRNFSEAAREFEHADDEAPSRQALRAAIQAHELRGEPEGTARAATLAHLLRIRYFDNPDALRIGTRVLARTSPGLGRIAVRCTACCITIDGRPQGGSMGYVVPGVHAVVVHLPSGRTIELQANAVAGQSIELTTDR